MRKYLQDQPAEYRICVRGVLDASWSERLGDMHIEHPAFAPEVTVLNGRLVDQAALFGVLEFLYTIGMPLLLVECLGLDESESAALASG